MSEADNVRRSQSARQVLEAADRLVAAFGEGRAVDYFACFHPEAKFVFAFALQDDGNWLAVHEHLSPAGG